MLTPNASCTLYLQTGPGAYTRVYVPACFWQDGEDGVSIVIPGELPEQYKGENGKRTTWCKASVWARSRTHRASVS